MLLKCQWLTNIYLFIFYHFSQRANADDSFNDIGWYNCFHYECTVTASEKVYCIVTFKHLTMRIIKNKTRQGQGREQDDKFLSLINDGLCWTCDLSFRCVLSPQVGGCADGVHEEQGVGQVFPRAPGIFEALLAPGLVPAQASAEDPQIPPPAACASRSCLPHNAV